MACASCGLLTSVDPTGGGGATTSTTSSSSGSVTTGGSTTGAGGNAAVPLCWPNAKPVTTCFDLGDEGPARRIALPTDGVSNFIVSVRSEPMMRAEVFEFAGDPETLSMPAALKKRYWAGDSGIALGPIAIDGSPTPRLFSASMDHLPGLVQRLADSGPPIQLIPAPPAMWVSPRVVKAQSVARAPSVTAGTVWALDDDCNVWNETSAGSEQMEPITRLNPSNPAFTATEFHMVASPEGHIYMSTSATNVGPALFGIAPTGKVIASHPLQGDGQPKGIQGLAADESYVYFLDFNSGNISRVAHGDFGMAGKEQVVAHVPGDDATTHDIAVDDHCLYRAGYNSTVTGYSLLACDKASAFACVELQALGPSVSHANVNGVAADARGLYYSYQGVDGKNAVCVIHGAP